MFNHKIFFRWIRSRTRFHLSHVLLHAYKHTFCYVYHSCVSIWCKTSSKLLMMFTNFHLISISCFICFLAKCRAKISTQMFVCVRFQNKSLIRTHLLWNLFLRLTCTNLFIYLYIYVGHFSQQNLLFLLKRSTSKTFLIFSTYAFLFLLLNWFKFPVKTLANEVIRKQVQCL